MPLDFVSLLPDEGVVGLAPYSPAWYQALQQLLGQSACKQLGIYVIPDDLLLSVVVPVYNERGTLARLLERIRGVPIRKQIVLVDDGSTDGSRELLESWAAESAGDPQNELDICLHDRNLGKGAALRTGFRQARGAVVVVQDADLEYDPDEYPRLLQPIVEDGADVVYGSRFLGDRPHRVLYFWHYAANRLLTTICNCVNDLNLTDMETGFKMFRRPVLEEIEPTLREARFGFEPEITAKVARRKHRVFEVAVSYNGRTYAEGKKIGWRDALSALWCIFRYGLRD